MSSLTKVTITKIEEVKINLKIERIHPDAPSLGWLSQQNEKELQANLLFRLLLLLENVQADTSHIYKLYETVYTLLCPYIEEEYGEQPELNKYTTLTEYGSDLLKNIVDQVIVTTKIVAEDINDNWEQGLIKNFNPYQTDGLGIPYVVFEIEFRAALLPEDVVGKVDYSALSISCKYK